MSDEKKQGRSVKKTRKLIISAVILAVVLLAVISIPAYLSSDSARPRILAKINSSLNDGQVGFKDLSVGWLSGIKAEKITYQDSAGTASVSVEKISTRPNYFSLLAGSLSLGRTVIDSPEIMIDMSKKPAAKPQASNRPAAEPAEPEKHFSLAVKNIDLVVNNGLINVNSADNRKIEVTNFNSKINLQDAGGSGSVDISMDLADDNGTSSLSASGDLKSGGKKWSLKDSMADFDIEVNNLDLGSVSTLLAIAGKDIDMGGVTNADIELKFQDSRIEKLSADASIEHLSCGGVVFDEPLKIKADISADDKAVNIETLDVNSSFCNIKCAGSNQKLDYDISGDLAACGRLVSQFHDLGGNSFAGRASVKGTAFIEAGRVNSSGRGQFENIVMSSRSGSTPATSADAYFDLKAAGDRLDISSFKINAGKTPGDGAAIEIKNAAVTFAADRKRTVDAVISASGQIGSIEPFAAFFDLIPKDMHISGSADSVIAVKSEADSYRLTTDSTKIKDLKITYKQKKPFIQDEVTAQFDIRIDTADKTIDLAKLSVKTPQISINKGQMKKTEKNGTVDLSGSFDYQYQWSAVCGLASAILPSDLNIEGSRKDTITFKSRYPAGSSALSNLTTQTDFGFDKADYFGMYMGPVETNLKFEKGLMTISPFKTTLNSGELNFSSTADFNKTPATLKLQQPAQIIKNVQINDETTKKLLRYLNPVFANAVNVTGIANLYCDKLAIPLSGAAKNDLEIQGSFSAEKIRLKSSDLLGQIMSMASRGSMEEEITIHPTKFTVADGLVRYDNMQIDVGNTPINFRGEIGLDKKMSMEVTLPYTSDGRTVKVGQENTPTRIVLPLRGTVDKPQIDMGSLLQNQLKQRLEKELGGKIEEKVFEELDKILR